MSRRQGNNSTVHRQRRLASLRFDQTEHRTVAALDEQHVLRSGDARRTLEIIAREFVEVWCSVQPTHSFRVCWQFDQANARIANFIFDLGIVNRQEPITVEPYQTAEVGKIRRLMKPARPRVGNRVR